MVKHFFISGKGEKMMFCCMTALCISLYFFNVWKVAYKKPCIA